MCYISFCYIINSIILERINIEYNQILTPSIITTMMFKKSSKWIQKGIDIIYRLGDQQNKSSNVKASMTSWTIWEETDYFNLLFNDIINATKHLNLLALRSLDNNREPFIHEAWGAYYKGDELAIKHNHEPSWYSFVYYLKAGKNCSPLIFEGSGDKKSSIIKQPLPNMLILFPSYLNHYVPPTKEERVVIAGNLQIKIN